MASMESTVAAKGEHLTSLHEEHCSAFCRMKATASSECAVLMSAVSKESVRGEKVQSQNIRKTKGAADPTSRRHTNPEACFPKLRLLEGSL